MIFIYLLAIASITYGLQEIDGPFNILLHLRSFLSKLPTFGYFFYKLFTCPYCLGAYSGAFVYLLSPEIFRVENLILWILAGAFCSLLMKNAISRLQ